MFHLKVVIIGPCRSGKTTIANFLSDSSENLIGEYRPTQGVRIVEFETQNLNTINRGLRAEVELWDCSGDLKYESSWPAMYKDAQGVVFVIDSSPGDSSSKLDYYIDSFMNQNNGMSTVSYKNCLVIEQSHDRNKENHSSYQTGQLSKIPCIYANIEDNGQTLRNDFNKYIASLLSGVRDRTEQDELNILTVS